MKTFFKYFKSEIPVALLGILFVGGVAFIELYQIQLMAQIIDVGIKQADFTIILSVGMKMIGLALLGAVLAMLGLVFPSEASNNFALKLRRDVFKKVQTFSIKEMNEFQTSSLVTRLTNDINFLQRTLMMMLRLLVRAPVFLISTVVLTYMTSPELSVVMLGAVVFLSMVLIYIVKQGFPRFIRLQKTVDNLNRKIQESLLNIRLIKSFVREDFEENDFDKENIAFFDASVNANMLMIIMSPALMAAINFATIIVIYVAAHLIVEFQMIQVGDLLVFINYLRFTMFSMMMITNVLMMMSRSKASTSRIKEVLATESAIQNTANKTLEQAQLSIEFRDVSFSYFADTSPVLKDINFKIEPNQHIGIIGSTGSGKTTLVNLLARLIEPTRGQILINDVDIKDYDLKSLRAQFGFVPQNNVLFSGTIAENLKLGNPEASDALLKQAVQTASIYDYIRSEPDGFDSVVQQGGSNFSGGQKQRLCLARALVNEPQVLILDDSTSALDAQTEQNVMRELTENYAHMTLISIAQKISSISQSDHIFVMDEGSIVGQGTHDYLLDTCQVYQEIYASQMKKGGLE